MAVICSRKKLLCGQRYSEFEPDTMALHPVAERKGVINPMSTTSEEDTEMEQQLENMEAHGEKMEDHYDTCNSR